MTITLATLRRLLGEPAASRGAAYARDGRVRSLDREADGRIVARVLGSGEVPYRASIRIGAGPDGSLRSIKGVCNCPVSFNCKHVAAALLALDDRGPDATGAGLPPALVAWLERVAAAEAPREDEDAYPPTVRDRLLYVLDRNATGAPVVQTMKASLKRDGSFGKGARRYDVSRFASSATPPKFLRPIDLLLGRAIERLGLGASSAHYYAPRLPPEPGEVAALLRRIAATGRGRWREISGPALAEGSPREGRIVWRAEEDGRQRPGVVDVEGAPVETLALDPPAYVDPGTGAIGPLTLDAPPRLARTLLAAPDVPPEAAAEVAAALDRFGGGRLATPRAMGVEVREGGRPVPVLRLFALTARRRTGYWSGQGALIELPALRLAFDYAGRRVAAFPHADPRFRDGDSVITLRRDRVAEDRAHARLDEAGAARLDDLGAVAPGPGLAALDRVFPVGLDAHDSGMEAEHEALRFVAETVPALRAEGWRVEIDPSWPYRLHEGPVAIRAGLRQGEAGAPGGRSVALTLEAGDERLDLAPLILSIVEALPIGPDGQLETGFDLDEFLEDLVLHQRLANGAHVPLQGEALAPLVRAFLGQLGLLDGFHEAEAARLADLAEALEGAGVPFEGGAALVDLGLRLRALATAPEVEPPQALTATLRPYQKTGYGWLSALAKTGFGGILADDMGLGKTMQTLALLVERHLAGGAERPSLVIAPTSLVGTWAREAARFAPELKILVLHGADRRARFEAIPDHHVVISTYPLLHRDVTRLAEQAWETVVLDEAQAVKNPASAAAKHIRRLEARARVALTGTPLQNSLEDLWALFDWLIPGLLGQRRAFRTAFRNPIERDGRRETQAALNARIRPFMLRRTKAEVATELPDKTEITELITLSEGQRALYETVRLTMDARVREAVAARGLAASRITILDALLKLRQVCCDPRLLKGAAGREAESAKRARLMELLESLVAEGRRVLVFSQFVTMLRLIEDEVQARGWAYAWLTGETTERDSAVAGFQAGEAPIFLISLKAGGVGLTLTAADTVILYDPWWNPAIEAQAMDRAHRIGQTRAVFVHRLVVEGSVEQAILELQDRKRAMADALFDHEASGPLELTEADLATLFRPLDAGPKSSE